MGMYCCCNWKITPSIYIDCIKKECITYKADPDGCTCDWNGWVSRYDWPEERKNKDIPFSEPNDEGEYLVRYQDSSGDRHETEQFYSKNPRKIKCGYTGTELLVNWSGDDESQPYAWKQK